MASTDTLMDTLMDNFVCFLGKRLEKSIISAILELDSKLDEVRYVCNTTIDRGNSSWKQILPGNLADWPQTGRENYAPEATGGTRKEVCDAG